MSLVLLSIPLSAGAAIIASLVGIEDASDGRQAAPLLLVACASLAGATLGAVAHSFGADAATTVSFSLLGAFLMAGAATDLETGCAADVSTMPVVLCAALAGSAPWSWGYGPAMALLVGLVLYMAVQAIWLASRNAPAAIPPSDLLSLLIPTLVLGASLTAAAFYLALCLLCLLIMKVPAVKSIFRRQDIADAIRDEGGSDRVAEEGVALLAVTYPLLAVFAGFSVTVFLQG